MYGVMGKDKEAAEKKIVTYMKYDTEEWKTEMRKQIISAAMDDKAVAFVCDEYRVTNDIWY